MFVGLCMCVCMCKFIYVCIEGEGGGERKRERERERKQARDSFCTCMYIHPDIHTQQCVYIYTHNYESTVNINTKSFKLKHKIWI